MGSLRRRLGVALIAAVVLTTAGCSHHKKTPVAISSTPAPTTSAAPPPPPPARWPLTGVLMGAPVDRPAIAVKIENSIDARPQTGLSSADMVWEEVVEGGITRYLAVYHSALPPVIGPVRSVRPMDPSIAGPLHGLFAFSGGQPPFPAAVAAAGLQVLSMDNGAAGFYRVNARRAPHNVYASLAVFLRQADANHRHSPPPQFAFAGTGEQPTAVVSGAPATRLNLTLSGIGHPVWTWSQPDGAWLRSEGATPAVEANGHRLHATNVVVLRVDVVNTRYIDPAGNPVPETRLIGAGAALVASAGHTVAATWSKSAVGATLALTGADHLPIKLAPGTTWIELVPNGTGGVSVG
ncbi:MAG: DUF3048 domain-containing protein [Blastococcus sp.]